MFPPRCAALHPLYWQPGTVTTRCPTCQLSAVSTTRRQRDPCLPLSLTGHATTVLPATFSTSSTPASVPGAHPTPPPLTRAFTTDNINCVCVTPPSTPSLRPLADDFLWASVRHHPDRHAIVLICGRHGVSAALTHRHAAYMRSLLLCQWLGNAPRLRINENDIAAFLLSWTTSVHPSLWPRPPRGPFRNQRHEFAVWDHQPEPGYLRPALLATTPGDLPFGHPSTSAYEPIARFNSPLSRDGHRQLLLQHPAGPFLVNCITYGFPLLSHTPSAPRHWRQHFSDDHNTPHATALLDEELSDGAFIPAPKGIPLRYAPLNLVFSNKWRLVSDLTAGPDSVNDLTDRTSLPRMRLAKLPTLARRILYMQEQHPDDPVLISKLDVQRAFRQVPLPVRDFHKAAHHTTKGDVVNARLMLGAKAACDLMAASISALTDVLGMHGIFADSYVDDVCLCTHRTDADATMTLALSLWHQLSWPINEKKLLSDGTPSTTKTFLGVTIDTVSATASVSPERVQELTALITTFTTAPTSMRRSHRELASLAGKLQFVSNVIPLANVFMHALRDATSLAADKGRSIRLSAELLSDLKWWLAALHDFNGVACFRPDPNVHSVLVYTDASGYGGAAVDTTNSTFSVIRWNDTVRAHSSTAHWELAAILLACLMYCLLVPGGYILLHSDSMASVLSLTRSKCRDPRMYRMLRVISLLQIRHRFRLLVQHIPGVDNDIADFPSRHGHMQPSLSHFANSPPSDAQLSLIYSLLGELPPWASAGTHLPTQLSDTGPVSSPPQTSPPLHMPWPLWTPTQRLPVFSYDSRSGCVTTPAPSQARPSPTMSARQRHTFALTTTSPSANPRC